MMFKCGFFRMFLTALRVALRIGSSSNLAEFEQVGRGGCYLLKGNIC